MSKLKSFSNLFVFYFSKTLDWDLKKRERARCSAVVGATERDGEEREERKKREKRESTRT